MKPVLDAQPTGGATALPWRAEPIDLPALATDRAAMRWLAPAISLGIFAAVLYQLRTLHLIDIVRLVPSAQAFWLLFAAYYLATPATDYLIFRRLWGLPPSGFLALTRKFVGNEILLGYIGELHFYGWARSRLRMVAAPFAAVKDVAILSALVGNAATLAMLLAAYPFLHALHLNVAPRTMLLSVATMLGTSAALLLMRRRLFSLPPRELLVVSTAQLGRVALVTLLPAALWHLALPQVALWVWLLLASIRSLLSRLPLLPNKDVVFAGVAALIAGPAIGIADLMTMMASLLLATHLLVGGALVVAEFAQRD